jgi:sodium transport system permease protein
MRLPYILSIYRKEMRDLIRDRRTMISMVIVPLVLFPMLMIVVTRVMGAMQDKSARDLKTMSVGVKTTNPAILDALRKAELQLVERDDLRRAVEQKSVLAGLEEVERAGQPPEIRVYSDNSNPGSAGASDRIRTALAEVRESAVREKLRAANVPEGVLTPFAVARINVAPPKKMAGMMWGSMLGYLLLLLMFSGGMYPVIDMTAGEKERRTLESFLATPAGRSEIVLGKMLAAMTAIFLTAMLTLGSIIVSVRINTVGSRSAEVREIFGTIPLDTNTVLLIVLTLAPLCVFAAAVMIAIAMFARSFKEGQSYLTPLVMVVVFPALLGGLPQLELTPALCLIPIFNASQLIRAILLGDFQTTAFGITLAANLGYAAIAMFVAKKRFEDESVLFRS